MEYFHIATTYTNSNKIEEQQQHKKDAPPFLQIEEQKQHKIYPDHRPESSQNPGT